MRSLAVLTTIRGASPGEPGRGNRAAAGESRAEGWRAYRNPPAGPLEPILTATSWRGRLRVRHYSGLRPQATDGDEEWASPQRANVSLDIYGHTGIRRGEFIIPCSVPPLRL
jgi:hypothetical protein